MIRSPVLDGAGFRHGFGARGDDEAALPEALGARAERMFRARQVHGREAHVVSADDVPGSVATIEADALVAGGEDAVGVVTADCLPIFLADQESGRVAAVHAGWRGVESGILHAAIDRLVALGADPRRLLAAIGPHIRVCCFEVGEDVALRLQAVSCAVDRSRPKPRVDLRRGVLAGLAARGVAWVDDVGGCTHCEPRRFHSYRRQGPRAGRQVSTVVARSGVRRTA